jgi:ketosteroid isomerase-like protein
MNFKKQFFLLITASLLCAVALAQTTTLQPTSPRPAPQVETGKGKKKSSKKSGKQVVTGEATQPSAGATGTAAAVTPDADALRMETAKGKGKKKGGGKKAVNNGGASAVSAIRAVLDAQVLAWNTGKLEDFMNGYWNSPELTFVSAGRKVMGYDATLERYRRTYQSDGKEMGKLTFGDLEIMPLSNDTAFVRGQFQLVMSDARELGGRFTLVLRQFAEGWKVVHDHTSANQ